MTNGVAAVAGGSAGQSYGRMCTRLTLCSRRLAAALLPSSVLVVLALAARPLRAQVDEALIARIAWTEGPAVGQLSDIAQVEVPEDCQFSDAEGAKQFLEATREPWSGRELGVLVCRIAPTADDAWFVLFTYNPIGLVRDDEKTSLNARKLLAGLRRTNDSINDLRRRLGSEGTAIAGWAQPPAYDSITHTLSWSTRLRDENSGGPEAVSHAVRVLGRDGDMNIDFAIVTESDDAVSELAERILRGFSFVAGHRYADWRPGDRLSEYGLTTLIVGTSGRNKSARVVVAMAAAAVGGFLIWLVLTMRKESRQQRVSGLTPG